MKCRICHADAAQPLGVLTPYTDYQCTIAHCSACGSRFAEHQTDTHHLLHASETSTYHAHDEQAQEVLRHFQAGHPEALARTLGRIDKYRHIIDALSSLPTTSRLLEVGCSRGALTAYFIARGYDVLGMDISQDAVEAAQARFGPHFTTRPLDELPPRSFDAVYHTGTIGCVPDPVGMTRQMLGLLKPGGVLVFNAPDVLHCLQVDALWNHFTPPPDLVTLFDQTFWTRQFGEEASVEMKRLALSPQKSARLWLNELLRRPYLPHPTGRLLDGGSAMTSHPLDRMVRAASKVMAHLYGGRPWWPIYAHPFGQQITMSVPDDGPDV